MKTPDLHPDTELLDRLRTGLMDDDPAHKAELETHLRDCEICHRRYTFNGMLQSETLASSDLDSRLNEARRQAMRMPTRHRKQKLIPLAVAAAIALVAVVLVNPVQELVPTDHQVASSNGKDVPELYEELDFYLWLADHNKDKDSTT